MVFPLMKIFFGYSLAIGITSQRLLNQRFRSSPFCRAYALVANIVTITLLPIVMWRIRLVFQSKQNFPYLVLITYNVRYLVSYLVILYTVLSRGFRDTAFKEMQPLLLKLRQREEQCGKVQATRRSLMVLIYVKFFTVFWMCITETASFFYSIDTFNWTNVATFIFLTNAANILEMVPMSYFLALWHIARGFDYVNQRLDEIVTSKSSTELKELKDLWLLHACLTKTTHNINKIFGPQMLASRFNYFIIGIIRGYWGAFFAFNESTPVYWMVYGSVGYQVRTLDNYLIDHMVDLVVEYQSSAKHAWSERRWTKEISGYVTYANSSKLQLWTCGLFQPNRSLWFDMISSVFYYMLMLLQFHLVMGNRFY
ncbi:putative gustatory receptor 59b [Drosophila elegans]|uniref:putative gustatory receptor 59b n=1 Tax=Drosophila elegans TaxID=30023 RepID=UPI001BC84051|nr:putative gustatory receptor 59b [Drosophila elegans]